ncbi:hypothetical protein K501DRAFT_266015 [Backusella circina FSU 941]|nr:hypothetical protein K501DRAFT_266015 [Backusella circina FSU 941]
MTGRKRENFQIGKQMQRGKGDGFRISKKISSFIVQEEAVEEEKQEVKKRKHISEAEFEKIMLEEEQQEKKNKKRKNADGRRVGEYTVKVISNRPNLQKAERNMTSFRNRHLNRKSVDRRDFMKFGSRGKMDAASVFKRS